MIRIKVFPLKKIIYRLQIMIAYLSFFSLVFVVLALLSMRKVVRTEVVLSRNLVPYNSNLNEEIMIKNIIRSKVKIIPDIDDLAEENEQQTDNDVYETENTDSIVNQDSINVDIIEFEEWNKPNKYETELLENGKIKVGNTTISNYSKLSLDLETLKQVSGVEIDDETNFLIYHTHTSETYTIDEEQYSDFYRTENENCNIVSVGKALTDELLSKGYSCVHEKTVHDYPSYNGAYKSSLATVEKQLENKDFDFVIDIHRDAISSNYNFRPTVQINGESVAKLMFVIGTNSAGLSHDEWMENLKLAIMIQNRASEMYPGLFRELHLSNSRYNQHVSNGAMILEVGATGNSLEEAQNAMKYLSNVIDSMKK